MITKNDLSFIEWSLKHRYKCVVTLVNTETYELKNKYIKIRYSSDNIGPINNFIDLIQDNLNEITIDLIDPYEINLSITNNLYEIINAFFTLENTLGGNDD